MKILFVKSSVLILFAWAFLPMFGGCASDPSQGYSFASTYDTSIQTVAIPIFKNQTTSRGLELQLTESLIKELKARTPWHIAPTDRADTTLAGVIVDTGLAPLSDSRTGLVQEMATQITIRFEWRDNRSGDIILARDQYTSTALFHPDRKVGDRLELGQRAVIQELAQDIVADMRSSW